MNLALNFGNSLNPIACLKLRDISVVLLTCFVFWFFSFLSCNLVSIMLEFIYSERDGEAVWGHSRVSVHRKVESV